LLNNNNNMKNLFTLIVLVTQITWGQMPPAVQQDLMNFEPGELIVKLKDNVDAGVTYLGNGKAMSSFNIGELLGIEDKIESSSVMFHQRSIESSIVNKEKMKAVYAAKAAANPNNGYVPEEPLTMKNIFVLKTLNEQENIQMLIEQIKNNPNIEYAEPNYIYSIDDFEVGETIFDETDDETDGETEDQEGSNETSDATIDVDDPLYFLQTNITSTNIDDVWDQYTTGDGSQIIAIIDTGVDYNHPDLEANIWINTEELNGVEGYDDDGNGYVDDIRGWDFINIDNAPLDDNMHGTHVAGIAGAVGNNGIGIAGAAWNVKLMPIKVFQSTGQGNITTIAAGEEYAYMNGATILNMSFGSQLQSLTQRAVLETAYSTSILVAASGNSETEIGGPCPPRCSAFFPAAYSFVLGVKDSYGGYDNFDESGPFMSNYADSELYNYEINAPGTQIMSTIPNGGYAALTGTSMASPLVAGALALYKNEKPDDSNELIFGNIINTSDLTPPSWSEPVDILDAISVTPAPGLVVLAAVAVDSISFGNGNGVFEPSETFEISALVRSFWGDSEDVRVGIEFAPFEDTSKATIDVGEIQLGSISSYATLLGIDRFVITIADNISNNVDIKFNLRAWSGPNQEYMSDPVEYIVNVKNTNLLTGHYINQTLVLEENKHYLATDVLVLEDTKVIIEPGVLLEFDTGLQTLFIGHSYWDANGTFDNPITIQGEDGLTYAPLGSRWPAQWQYMINGSWGTYVDMSDPMNFYQQDLDLQTSPLRTLSTYDYVIFKNIVYDGDDNYISYGGDLLMQNCIFEGFNVFQHAGVIYKSNIKSDSYDSWMGTNVGGTIGGFAFPSFNNITNKLPNYMQYSYTTTSNFITYQEYGSTDLNYLVHELRGFDATGLNQTWGTTNESEVNGFTSQSSFMGPSTIEMFKLINNDILTGGANQNGLFDWGNSNVRLQPYEQAPGIVWKILVNGKNALDEYNLMDPIGVGSHEFKVYFNRAMDTSVDPQISYGVTIPYTQKIISETGTWSEDGKIYTVTHGFKIGAADGINRIRVSQARDLELFEIPIENLRFSMLVQSAGSASLGWSATAGLGNIALAWEAPSAESLDDVLGYNMYRYEVDADGVESTPVKLNETLIVEDTDESTTGVYYTDFNVTEGETYFYKYNILRTSFEVTDYSSVVSTTPLTSTLGDSNGDFSVNVLDLVHDVDYILGNNPTPFIFLAGDVNADLAINVLDIVATVDIILNPSDLTDSSIGSTDIQFYPSASIGNATFSWEGNDLFVEADHNIGGLQLAFSNDFEYTVSSELTTIEKLDYIQEDNKIVMLFSFNNTVISSGKTKLLTRLDETKDLNIDLAVVGTTSGSKLTAIFEDTNLEDIESPFQSDSLEFLSMIPNPTSGMVNLKYYLPEQMDGVVAKVYDIQGRLVWSQRLENKEGASETQMNLNKLQTGNYIVLISGNKNGGLKTLAHKMLIVK